MDNLGKHEPNNPGGYYPSHLTHGLLAAHCATITECRSSGNENAEVSLNFSEDHSLFQDFKKQYKININEYISDWKLLMVVNEEETGYLGTIYKNECCKHLVVAHRSTNLALSLKYENRLKQSSLHQDIEGVLVGNITLHQANGYYLTAKAVALILTTHKNYSLSFAGHSLGAWLAELSVLYCHDSFNFGYSRAITFDGPGSLEMMQTLRSGDIKGPTNSDQCKLEDLDIISYLTAPNVVNCANKHVGTVYRIFPENTSTKDSFVKKLPDWCVNTKFLKYLAGKIIDHTCLELLSLGHSLQYILPEFSLETGKPKEYKQVEKWPSITYESFSKYSSCNLVTSTIIKKFRSASPKVPNGMEVNESGINVGNKVIFHWNHTTLDSIAHLALILLKGKINLQQFWLVHKYLNKDCGFIENPQNEIDDFFLHYKAQYKASNIDPWTRRNTGDQIDKCLKALEINKNNIQGQILVDIVEKYHYENVSRIFVIKEQFRKSHITIEYTRDTIKNMCRTDPDFKSYVNNINKIRLVGNIRDFNCNTKINTMPIHGIYSKGHRILILKGMTGQGKTTLAKAYAKYNEKEFTSRIILANSKGSFDKSLNECAKSLMLKISDSHKNDIVSNVKDQLNTTKQKVLFILDDVSNFDLISSFVESFETMNAIKILITTQNDRLGHKKTISEISAKYLPDGNAKVDLQAKIKHILESLFPKLRSKSKLASDFIRCISFVKSGAISETELMRCLQVNDTDAIETLEKLKSLSLVTVDTKNNICINALVQSVALEMSDFKSAYDLLQFLSPFGAQNLVASSILQKLMAFDIEQEQEKIARLESILDMNKRCNMQNIVNCLQEENCKGGKQDSGNCKFLKGLNTQLIDIIDNKLQHLMTNLGDSWTGSQNSKHRFFTEQSDNVVDILRAFTNFQNRIDSECLQQKASQEFAHCKHVFVIGPTGSGKSTVINFLVGNTLECIKVGRNGAETIINVIPKQNNSVATIGNTLNSQTNSIRPYFNKEQNIVYWDFPGFFDTRGDIQKMQHAFLLKSFSESLTNSKILLVVESSTVSTMRGQTFVNLLNKLNQLCPIDKFQNGMSLLVTKCDSFDSHEERDADKRYFLKIFSNIFEGRKNGSLSSFLGFLKRENMLQKMALISKVTKRGVIAEDFFHGLNSAIGESKFENIVFNLKFDDDVILKIIHLGDMLSDFAEYIVQEIASNRIATLKSVIQQETFQKDQLLKINKFHLGYPEFGFREITGEQVQADILTMINDTIKFFYYLNCNSVANIDVWLASLVQFNFHYDQLTRPAKVDFVEDNVVKIEAPILPSSFIQELYNEKKSNINSVEILCLIFIVDQDLNLPGVNLAVSSLEWRIINSREIRLVGTGSGDNKNSGNFYGDAKNVIGGKVSFVLDGVNGEDGVFDPSKSEQIRKNRENIERLKIQISSIEKLRTFRGLSLEAHRDYLKNEEKNSREELQELEKELKEVNKRLNNISWSGTKNKDLITKQQLEKDVETQSARLEKQQQDLNLVEKVMEINSIHQNYDSIPKECPTIKRSLNALLDLAVDQSSKKDISKEIKKFREETNEIYAFLESMLEKGQEDKSKFKEINNALEKAKNVHHSLKNIAAKQEIDRDFFTWEKVFHDAERRILEKHSIIINGFELELSAKELNDILSQKKSEIQTNLEKELKFETKKLSDYKKQIKDSGKNIVRFYKQHQRRKEYKAQRDKKFKFMTGLKEQLRKTCPNEFSVLDDTLKQISKATVLKEQMVKNVDDLICKMDGPVEDETRNNREILRPVTNSETVKTVKKQIASSENKHTQQKCDKLIGVLKQHAEVTTKIQLLEVKKYINTLVYQYQLGKELYYQIDSNDETSLKDDLDELRKKLKKLCNECDIFSDYITSNVLADDSLDVAVQMQYVELENLQRKLEYAKQHQGEMVEAIEKLSAANEQYETAKKNYDRWRQNNRIKNSVLDYFLKVYEEFLECDQNWRSSFEVETKIAEELLFKPSNLVSRKERKWNDRDLSGKTTFVLKEIFVFTRQYYEKYSISGSDGFPGSNSGAFEFKGEKNPIGSISTNPGLGGQHACVLEGIYANEYSFPFLRRIQQKLGDENFGNINQNRNIMLSAVDAAGVLEDIVSLLFSNASATVSTVSASVKALQVSTAVITAISLIASPIIASLWSHWSEGPYKYDRGSAPNGEQGTIHPQLLQNYETEFSQYLEQKLQQELQSYIFNERL